MKGIFQAALLRSLIRPEPGDRSVVPRSGPCIFVCLYRSRFDPLIISIGSGRRIHFLNGPKADETAGMWERAAELSQKGIAVAYFPEEEASLYGETVVDPAVFINIKQLNVPILVPTLYGSYDLPPTFPRFFRRERLSLNFTACAGNCLEEAFKTASEAERVADIRIRAEKRARDAREIRKIIYICPACGELFTLRGDSYGHITCRSCGGAWTLLYGKGLRNEAGGDILPLTYIHDTIIREITARRLKTLYMPVTSKGADGRFLPAEDHFILALKGSRPSAFVIPNNDVQSVHVHGEELWVEATRSGGTEAFSFAPPPYALFFLAHMLRIRSFGNPYARFRGDGRRIYV